MPERIVGVHQPTFLPWLGFFDKLRRSDVFVLLDDVQFARGGHGNWVNRVRLLVNGAATWVTVPVRRSKRGLQAIRSVEITDDANWRGTLLSTLRVHYRRAAAFDEIMPRLTEIVEFPATSIAEFNIHAIECLQTCLALGATRLVRQSALGGDGHSTDLLIRLVREVGGTAYLCGDGSDDYLDADAFGQAGLELRFQRFEHPVYTQSGVAEFVAGLSIVDALMHCGVAGVRRLLVRPASTGRGVEGTTAVE